ncbi:MAG: hypothetical protein K9M11_01350 [Candidatus Pacebacteria bacterium]|nr:hypothetical protein [Candidatus Paceibacterota bacterium]
MNNSISTNNFNKSILGLLVAVVLVVLASFIYSISSPNKDINTDSQTASSTPSSSTSTAQNSTTTKLVDYKWIEQYIHPVEWPPKFSTLDQAFSCTESAVSDQTGLPISQGGQTTMRTIGTRTYCITQESEGAAGSTYTTYIYKFASSNGGGAKTTDVLEFTLRAVQCLNYDDPQKTACEDERKSIDIDVIVDSVVDVLE